MFKNFVISVLLIAGASKAGFGQTHVQTTTLYQVSVSTTITKAFAAASTTGNLIVVHLDWDNQARNILTVTDNKGNTYTRINGPTNWNGANYRAELWYAYNITGGGAAISITANLSGAPTSFSQIYISEYSGIVTTNPLDQNSVAIGNSNAVSSGAKTTTYDHELIYGASIGASGVLTTGAGFTNRSAANSNIIEDKKAPAIGSNDAKFTSASGNWIAQMATFITTSSTIILPIDLISFTGQCNNNKIDLDWSTGSETNNNYFTIERSDDGRGWEAVGTVKSQGNSTHVQKYSFAAEEANGAISYFRLKQTDIDGKDQYFSIIQVNNCTMNTRAVSLFPNPSNGGAIHVRISGGGNETSSVAVYDGFGKIVGCFSSNQPEFSLNFSQTLPSGIYFARLSSGTFSKAFSFLVAH
jgi:hypothetical protein